MLLISCSTKKKTVYTPATSGKTKSETKSDSVADSRIKVDTVYWDEIDLSDDYKSTIEDLLIEKKDVYKISLLYPFELSGNKIEDINDRKTKLGRMTHYYAGTLMALDQLQKEGLNLEIEVMDAESGRFENKLQSCKDADLIIGPRDTDQLSVVANFGKVNKIPVFSPWKSGSRISSENPYFIQLKTGLREHFYKIIEHALSEFETDEIYIIGREEERADQSYIRIMQEMAATLTNSDNPRPLKEFYVDVDSLKYGKTAFDGVFSKTDTTCFILPHWSFSADEDFVYDVARKMSGEKALYDVVLYGLPILYESDRIKFELYRNLNMRICRSSFVDNNSPVVKAFREAYFNKYRDFPGDEAYEAYDMMLFAGRSLQQYGINFPYFLDRYEYRMLQTRYDIQKVYDENNRDDFDQIDYYQNKHLYILSFEDDRFVTN